MPAKITSIIPPQKFEVVRDRIALIVTEELANQAALGVSVADLKKVYIDRIVPPNLAELPMANVSFKRINYENQTTLQADGSNTYYVDIFVSSKFTNSERGDTVSSSDAARLGGMVRAIIENPIYRNLDFPAPYLSRVTVDSVEMAELNADNKDANSTIVCRVTITVEMPEKTQLLEGIEADGVIASVKLATTERGYRYVDLESTP